MSILVTTFIQGFCYVPGTFSISGEWLYWLSGLDNGFFAVQSEDFTLSGNQFVNKPRWHSGVRLEAAYHLCDANLRLKATYFPEFSNTRTIRDTSVSEFGDARTGAPLFANHTFNFYAIELLYDHPIFCSCPFSLSIEGGLQYAHLHFHGTYNLTSPGGFDNNDLTSKRDGIGPELGLELFYSLCQPLAIKMRGSGALLVTNTRGSWVQNRIAGSSNTTDETFWNILPMASFRLALNYCLPMNGCWSFDAEIGYEIVSYFSAFNQFNNFDLKTFQYNYIAHGPCARIGMTF